MSDEEPDKKKSPIKTAAVLRENYLRLLRRGLGHDAMSPGEEAEAIAVVDDAVSDVFMLYARVQMARSLGILPWFAAVMFGDPTTRGSDGTEL